MEQPNREMGRKIELNDPCYTPWNYIKGYLKEEKGVWVGWVQGKLGKSEGNGRGAFKA